MDTPDTIPERRLCLLTVHFNNADEVEVFLDHVLSLPVPAGWNLSVSISDNSRSWPVDHDVDPRVSIWTPSGNLGYLSGCSYALECWRLREKTVPDWAVITNTDISLDRDALLRFLSIDWPQRVGAVAPKIRTRTHPDQNPFMLSRPSARRLQLLRIFFSDGAWRKTASRFLESRAYTVWRSFRRILTRRLQHAGSVGIDTSPAGRRIYAPHGSFVFLARTFFTSGCELSIPWMMYGEEIHLAEQIRRASLDVLWVPEIAVTHHMSSTTGSVDRGQLMEWRAESLRNLIGRYFRTD